MVCHFRIGLRLSILASSDEEKYGKNTWKQVIKTGIKVRATATQNKLSLVQKIDA